MSRSRRGIIPEKDWENHKGRIEKLFLVERKILLGHDGVIEIMTREHGFYARYAIFWNLSYRICVIRSAFLTPSQQISIRDEAEKMGLSKIRNQRAMDLDLPRSRRSEAPGKGQPCILQGREHTGRED